VPPFVDGIDIGQKFTSEEIFDLHRRGKLRSITLEGYVTRVDILDNTISFVPFWESSKFRDETGQMKMTEFGIEEKRKELEDEHPISRRTPQERVAALAMRLVGEIKRSGRVGGLSDEDITQLTSESWKAGEPLLASDARTIAATLLSKAEKENKEAESHRVTRDFRTA